MENKQLIWAKTFLVAYKYLGTLCSAIDRIIDATAENSFYCGSIWRESNSIYNVSNKILSLSERKIDYINLKVMVDKVLKKMSRKHAKILILRFIEQLSPDDIAGVIHMSTRSYFRLYKSSLESFAKTMKQLEFNFEDIEKRYLQDAFIESVYEQVGKNERVNIEEGEVLYNDTQFNKYLKTLNRGQLVEVII